MIEENQLIDVLLWLLCYFCLQRNEQGRASCLSIVMPDCLLLSLMVLGRIWFVLVCINFFEIFNIWMLILLSDETQLIVSYLGLVYFYACGVYEQGRASCSLRGMLEFFSSSCYFYLDECF